MTVGFDSKDLETWEQSTTVFFMGPLFDFSKP